MSKRLYQRALEPFTLDERLRRLERHVEELTGVVAASYLLRATGRSVGDTLTLSTDTGRRDVRVVGEAFDPRANGLALSAVTATLSGLDDHVQPDRFEIGLTPGTDPDAYVRALN